jgi:hypothetical protein
VGHRGRLNVAAKRKFSAVARNCSPIILLVVYYSNCKTISATLQHCGAKLTNNFSSIVEKIIGAVTC